MRRKWLLTTTLIIIGTTTLFGCGKDNTSATTEVTTSQEVTTQAPEATTQVPETTTQAPETTTQAPETTTQTPETSESTTSEVLSPKVDKETKGSGTFTGQVDSNSIEVEMSDGSYQTFFIYDEDVAEQFNTMDIGTKISFTYGPIKGQVNPEILSVTVK